MSELASSKSIAAPPWGVSGRAAQDVSPSDVGFDVTDKRYDPLVGATLCVLHRLWVYTEPFPARTAVIAVTDVGCRAHVDRVVQALSEGMRPRQAIFARASARMLATYPALALSTHGPTFALSGGAATLRWALALAVSLIGNQQCEAAVLIAADTLDDPPQCQVSVMMFLRQREHS